jgi:hypothetical protein
MSPAAAQNARPQTKPIITGLVDMQTIIWHYEDGGEPTFPIDNVAHFPGLHEVHDTERLARVVRPRVCNAKTAGTYVLQPVQPYKMESGDKWVITGRASEGFRSQP